MTYLYTEAEREAAILNGTPGQIYFEHQDVSDISAFDNGIFENRIDINPFGAPVYIILQRNVSAGETVRNFSTQIDNAATEFNINPSLLRAVIYTEVARGVYENPFSSTFLPGNVAEKWEALIPGSDVHNSSDNIRLAAKLLSEISGRLDTPYPEDVYALYNSLAHDRTYQNADLKSTPYFMKEAMANEAWEQQEWHLGDQTGTLKVTLSEVGYYSWADVILGDGTISDVGSFFWDSFTNDNQAVDDFDAFVSHLLEKWDGNLTDASKDIFGETTVTDTTDRFITHGNAFDTAESLDGTISDPSGVLAANGPNGSAFSIIEDGVTLLADGVSYALDSVVNSVEAAAAAVGKFISDFADAGVEWFTAENGARLAFGTWLSQNVDDLLAGDLSLDDAVVDLGQYFAGSFLSGYVVNDVLDAHKAIAKALHEEFGVGDDPFDAQGNLIPNSTAARYAADLAASLTQMVATFVTSGFDTEQAVNAGVAVAAGKLTATFLEEADYISGGYSGEITVAIATAVGQVLSGDFDGDFAKLGAQVGLAVSVYAASEAVASGAVGTAINNAFNGATFFGVDPATIVASIVIGFIAQKVLGKALFGSVKFGKGEFASEAQVLNSVYQVQTIEVDGEQVPALVAVNAQGSTIIASNIAYILGGGGADVLAGDAGDQTFLGNAGSDYIEARAGNDNALGGSGNDLINGGSGDDIIQGDAGDDLLFGEAGDDIAIAGDGDDFVHLGSGNDIAAGGEGNDHILAGGDHDAVSGDAGDDLIDGGYGDDDLSGGTGTDLMLGNLGNDLMDGGDGNDTLFGAEGNDQVYGGKGADFIDGGEGSDILHGDNGIDFLVGGEGDDFAEGGLGNDNILGGAGDDVLLGGMDDDYLKGEADDDSLDGGYGDDILVGGTGVNTLNGGEGSDIYVIGSDVNEHDNVIAETGSDSDTILLNWLSDTDAASDLVLEQVGDDLKISYDGRVLATIDDQFILGHEVETIELADGKFITLANVTYDSMTHLNDPFTINTGSVTTNAAVREEDVEENLVSQQLYWNAAYLQKLSLQAYEEELNNEIGYTYYDGTQVITLRRSTGGLFSSKYTVFKINQAGNIEGTNIGDKVYSILDADDQTAASPFWNDNATLNMPYDPADVQAATIYYSSFGVYDYQDIVIGGTVVSSKIAGDPVRYTPGATLHGSSLAARMAKATTEGTVYTGNVLETDFGHDLLVGAYWNESISGGSGDDVLVGNDGVDTLNGGDGEDWLFGGDGNDIASGGAGVDNLFGGAGNDSLDAGADDDVVLGADGNDTIVSGDGDDWIDAGNDDDSVIAGAGADIIFGNDGNDTLLGGDGDDALHGGDGNDSLSGGNGNDTLYGSEGSDTLDGGAGDDTVDATSQDVISYESSPAAVSINLATGVFSGGDAAGDHIEGITAFIGSAYNDTMVGGAAAVYFRGGDGNDSLTGGAGANTIEGGAGSDALIGGTDTLNGGGDTPDTLDYRNSTAAVSIDLSTGAASGGHAAGDTISGFEDVYGSAFKDTVTGGSGNNHFYGFDDNDSLTGGDGDDTLDGGLGRDTLKGGNGIDWADYQYSSAAVTINMGTTASQTGSGGDGFYDRLYDIENLRGSAFGDTITGSTAANLIEGMDGDDVFISGAGADTLDGGDGIDTVDYQASAAINLNMLTNVSTGSHAAGDVLTNIEVIYATENNDTITLNHDGIYVFGLDGNDSILGGNGDDTLDGGDNSDTLNGGSGIDTADYRSSDGAVKINLALATAQYNYAAGDVLSNIENVYGSNYGDTLTGDNGNNYLRGMDGDDTLYGGDGSDTLEGGVGSDQLYGGNGIDWADYQHSSLAVDANLTMQASNGDADGDDLYDIENLRGSAFNDSLTGNTGANELHGLDGNDTLIGGGGADTLRGGNGNDYVSYKASGSAVNINMATGVGIGGDAENDVLESIESTIGSNYNDTLTGNAEANYLKGESGNDLLEGGAGADTLDGDGGTDTASYASSSAAVNVSLAITTAQSGGDAAGDVLSSIENLTGSAFDDSLRGNGGNNVIYGLAGDDFIEGGSGADTIDGGDGYDIVSYAWSPSEVTINLATGTFSGGHAEGDILTNIEAIHGSNQDDILTAGNVAGGVIAGNDGNDLVTGGTLDDTLDGGLGNDTLSGGNGADSLIGGAGADNIDGGADIDTIDYSASTAAITVNLGSAGSQSGGDAAGDVLANIENIIGTSDDDSITGSAADNIIEGGAGADTLDGAGGTDTADYVHSSAGVSINLLTNTHSGGHATGDSLANIENIRGSLFNDTLTGSATANLLEGLNGNDLIAGGNGADTLDGGTGDDTLNGGAGSDSLIGGDGIDTADYSDSSSAVTIDLTLATAQSGGDAAGDILAGFENVIGSANDDSIAGDGNDNIIEGGAGADTLSAAAGIDTVTYESSSSAVNVDLTLATTQSGGDAAGDILSGFENVIGSAGDDTITGDGGDNVIEGGAGADMLDGGSGSDTVDYTHSAVGVNVSLLLNVAQSSSGDADGDVLSSFENVRGTAFDDTLLGNTAANALYGNGGDDFLAGGDGDDTLDGGSGADTLDGGTGNDTLSYANSNAAVNVNLLISTATGGWATGDVVSNFEHAAGSAYNDTLTGSSADNVLNGLAGEDLLIGGAGADTLTGGAGADIFQFLAKSHSAGASIDTITDFTQGDDLIDLSGLGFTGIQSGAGSGSVLGYTSAGGTTTIAAADSSFTLNLTGTFTLVAGDFDFT